MVTESDFVTAFRTSADDLARPPPSEEMDTDGPHALSTYLRRWDSCGGVLLEAGLAEVYYREQRRGTQPPESVLLAHLREFAATLKEPLSATVMVNDG
jgi:hypothetical protein